MTFADYILEKIRLATDLPKCIASIVGEYFFDKQMVMVKIPMEVKMEVPTFNRITGNKGTRIYDTLIRYGKYKLLNMVGSQLYQIYIAFDEKLYNYLEIAFSRFLLGFDMVSEEHIGYGMDPTEPDRIYYSLGRVITQEIEFSYKMSIRNDKITENTMVYFPHHIMVPAWCLQKYTS